MRFQLVNTLRREGKRQKHPPSFHYGVTGPPSFHFSLLRQLADTPRQDGVIRRKKIKEKSKKQKVYPVNSVTI